MFANGLLLNSILLNMTLRDSTIVFLKITDKCEQVCDLVWYPKSVSNSVKEEIFEMNMRNQQFG